MSNLSLQELTARGGELMRILREEAITPVFQPVISLRDGSVLGYEALSRGPAGTEMESPDMLFSVAEAVQEIWELEKLCRAKALAAVKNAPADVLLFLNVNPSVVEDVKFQKGFTKDYLKAFGIAPDRVIFEITERSACQNMEEFKRIIGYYKGQQYKIAIDDAGAGYSGLNLITDLRPHYLKLDMGLVRGIDRDTVRQALVKSLQEFAKVTGTYLVAEGIETREELEALIHFGVQYGQGYYIRRPTPGFSGVPEEAAAVIKDINGKKNHLYGYSLSDVYIGNLSFPEPSINEMVPVQDAHAMLHRGGAQGFCVTRNGVVVGVATRHAISEAVSGAYGYSLNAKKPISSIMDRDFLALDCQTPVTLAGKLAMARPDSKVYNFITVTRDGQYDGIVTIKDLLNKTLEIEVSNAMQLNPLTSLPGNPLIERALSNMLYERRERCVLYFDIDNFKAYNDVYGFENGDRVIRHLAACIQEALPDGQFLGHVGGDDFVAVVHPPEAEPFCRAVIGRFDGTVRSFYSAADAGNGYILSRDRQGREEQFPIISISIAGVRSEAGRFSDIYQLSAEASRVKKECKHIPGSKHIVV
jgi:EAL domain-containing protein (putative c-di-GMP-specific phosphodiesterase class I)/GGDEF domain-containing protein